ncbi:MAG: DEAD/DEAH box helicase [archaeon]|nr:MAG: DEAD/DEAH box helicase [archaeon]
MAPEGNSSLLGGTLKSSLVYDAGFEFDEGSSSFILRRETDLRPGLEYAFNLLKSEGIGFTQDESVRKLRLTIENQVKALVESIGAGERIKKEAVQSESYPHGFKLPLLPSQRKAVALHLGLPYSADFSVPGAGKTWIGYAVFSTLRRRKQVKKLLVVGPISSFRPWEEEHLLIFGKKANFREIKGSRAERHLAIKEGIKNEILLISYHSISNDEQKVAELLSLDDFMVILDESHNVKQPEAKRTNAVLRLAKLCKHRMILSGTPIPRSIEDIYTQFAFLDPDRDVLGQESDFIGMVDQDESLELLKQRISSFYYRIRKSEFDPKLPNVEFFKESISMGSGEVMGPGGKLVGKVAPCPNQESIYFAIEGRVYNMIQKERKRKGSVYERWEEIAQLKYWQRARLLRLLQVASNPALLMKEDLQLGVDKLDSVGLPIYQRIREYSRLNEKPVKLQRAEDLAKSYLNRDSDSKVLIWTSFVRNIFELKKGLKDYSPAIVHGDIAKDPDENVYFNRIDEVAKFKNTSKCRVLIANPASLAESVSLHKNFRGEVVCSTAIYVDRTFNGAHYMQSLDRIHRIGLKKDQKVTYHILHAAQTVDLDVDDSLTNKIQNMERFLDDDIRQFNLEVNYGDITDGISDKEDYERVVKRLEQHSREGRFD